MSLYIIVGVMSLNTTYYIVLAFLSIEMVDDYHWVLSIVKKLYEFLNILDWKVIVTNADPNIICAILEKFLLVSHLLYLWHMNKNGMANCKKLFEDKKAVKKFYEE